MIVVSQSEPYRMFLSRSSEILVHYRFLRPPLCHPTTEPVQRYLENTIQRNKPEKTCCKRRCSNRNTNYDFEYSLFPLHIAQYFSIARVTLGNACETRSHKDLSDNKPELRSNREASFSGVSVNQDDEQNI